MGIVPIRDAAADRQFRDACGQEGLNPDDRWIGGYVDYQWTHVRHLLEALPEPVAGKRVLEFGANYGATSVVLALLGAQVTAVDVDESAIEIARLNAKRYGVENSVRFEAIADTTHLPYGTATFDLVTCISVLEYVPAEHLGAVQCEIDRVLRPGGVILVSGTSSRLWPREVHSRRWLVNYLPTNWFNSGWIQRGIWPWHVHLGFGTGYINLDREDCGATFRRTRAAMGASAAKRVALAIAAPIAQRAGTSAGLWMPNISVTLRKACQDKR